MTVLIVIAVLVIVIVGLGWSIPKLVIKRDERSARPPTGLGDAIPDLEELTVATDDGALLHVAMRGQGRPIVLVHGLSLDHRSWHYQLLDLGGRFRVIAPDLRGHGRSTAGSEPIGPHRFAADLAAVLEACDVRGAVLVGHSLGGTVVGQCCADYPETIRERVAGLVFVDTFASAIAGEGRLRELCSPTLIRLAAKVRSGSQPREEAPTRGFTYLAARSSFGPNPQPEQVRHTIAMSSSTAPAVVGAATVANIKYDVRQQLAAVSLPSLVIRGAHDGLSTARSTAQLQTSLPNAQVIAFDDCGHLPMLEDREHFDDVLTAFAEGVGSSATDARRPDG
jgi:pimeloyl-ACP methyl ester carboxylesterase